MFPDCLCLVRAWGDWVGEREFQVLNLSFQKDKELVAPGSGQRLHSLPSLRCPLCELA